MMSRARRSRVVPARILMPDAATAPNITMAAPPSTGSGMAWSTPATAGNRPSRTSIRAIHWPIWRLAMPVSWITPLFCAKTELGKVLNRPASRELAPLTSTPPLIRCIHSGPSTGWRDTLLVAVTSPMASREVTR
ncbi:hypothetical protein D3C72_1931190 [compost metagenome]